MRFDMACVSPLLERAFLHSCALLVHAEGLSECAAMCFPVRVSAPIDGTSLPPHTFSAFEGSSCRFYPLHPYCRASHESRSRQDAHAQRQRNQLLTIECVHVDVVSSSRDEVGEISRFSHFIRTQVASILGCDLDLWY